MFLLALRIGFACSPFLLLVMCVSLYGRVCLLVFLFAF